METVRNCSACGIEHPLNVQYFKQKRDRTFNKQCKHCCELKRNSAIRKSMCGHNQQKHQCKMCSDPIEITIRSILNHSKNSDKKYNRYDPVNFIDFCFVENLIDDCEDKCYYCECQLQYTNFESNLATIERLDNNKGHIKGNVVIACRRCNYSRVGDRK